MAVVAATWSGKFISNRGYVDKAQKSMEGGLVSGRTATDECLSRFPPRIPIPRVSTLQCLAIQSGCFNLCNFRGEARRANRRREWWFEGRDKLRPRRWLHVQ